MLARKLLALLIAFVIVHSVHADMLFDVRSPDGRVRLAINHQTSGFVIYGLEYKGKIVIQSSGLGFYLKVPEKRLLQFNLEGIDSSLVDETWKPVWGEQGSIRNHYRQLRLRLIDRQRSGIKLNIIFRIFNDGIGFRYEFPQQDSLHHFIIGHELTQFEMTGDHKAFWIPGDYDTNEFTYYTTRLSEIDASGGGAVQEIHAKTSFDKHAVQTPLMMKTADGLYINIHEAALRNYPTMNLVLEKPLHRFRAALVPDAVGNTAYLQTPAQTPWRTILVSDKAGDILTSRTILNLNEPTALTDVSWIKPQKFVGVWWEMHVGKSSWDYSGLQVGSQQKTRVPHGANTANVKRYIDFAAKNGIDGVLVEGWNTGWEDWFGQWKEDVFDFVTPYPDFDVKELSAYAQSKGVKIIMHHETSASVTNYERWMDTAYRFMKKFGYNSVKTGYVGRIIPRGEHHDGQWMQKHFERVAKKTGDYRIMVDMHESTRLTGMHRTYPNWLASEAARGNEFNAWSVGNPPDHETILPFTRLMGGPMDYTPGIFKIKMSHYDSSKKEQVHTTLAKQLALYVTMYSPLQMAADLPENYEARPDAFQFIKDVAVDWDDTKVLDAEPGDYIIMARKAKGANNWYVGAITDENARNFTSLLDFLETGRNYIATIYRDGDNADWKNNPEEYVIDRFIVNNKTKLKLKLAPGGGAAISLIPASEEEVKKLKKYK
jgi:glucan 1,4-alpha-glucosidase